MVDLLHAMALAATSGEAGSPRRTAKLALVTSTASRPAKPMLQGLASTKQPICAVESNLRHGPPVGLPPVVEANSTWLVWSR